MGILRKFSQKIVALASHRHAGIYLCLFSFLESFILPVSPAVLQVPITLAQPKKAWSYTLYAFLGSFLGGIVGYLIGYYVLRWMFPHIEMSSYHGDYLRVKSWVATYGIWILFPVSFLPIPYKVTTVASGLLGIPFYLFLFITLPGRFLHFWVISYVMSHEKILRFKAYLIRHYDTFRKKKRS